MPGRLRNVIINVTDLQAQTEFWTEVLGYEKAMGDETWAALLDPDGKGFPLGLQAWSTPKDGPNRLHLDVEADDVEAEVERLIGLGATRIDWDYPDEATWVVLADPEGNEFCVVQAGRL